MALSFRGPSRVAIHVENPHGNTDNKVLLEPTAASRTGALQCLSPSQVQNRQRDVSLTKDKGLLLDSGRQTSLEPVGAARDLFISTQPSSQSSKSQRNLKASRKALHGLETVPENTSSDFCVADTERSSQLHCLELSARQFPEHPILAAAGRIPPAAAQRQKHQSGDFEWVLVIKQLSSSVFGDKKGSTGKKLLLGCNLYPRPQVPGCGSTSSESDTDRILLLATPLKDDHEDLERASIGSARIPQIMAVSEREDMSQTMSLKQQSSQPAPPRFIITVSDTEESPVQNSHVKALDGEHVARIEDSFEAIDKLEDQLEAFDEAAHFKRVTIVEPPSSKPANPAPSTPSARPNISQKQGSASVRVKPVSRAGQPTLRKSLSMVFDSPKVKREEKPLLQVASKVSPARAPSLLPPKPPVKSSKPLTVPSFELPGEATARRLKEQREARAAAQSAEEEASKAIAQGATLRRSKSARLTSLPTFELPGEAISRRKREERARQLKAQEEEDRRRREFKARPIGTACAPGSFPRETMASRARQQTKAATSENDSSRSTTTSNSKRSSLGVHMLSRGPLEPTSNQGTPRGRALSGDTRPSVRAVSHASSAGSTGQSSSISTEDIQQQRRKGEGIFRRDSSFAKNREVEKREREEAARAARAEAAERSRLQSREWALKQARKRATIGSLRDLQS